MQTVWLAIIWLFAYIASIFSSFKEFIKPSIAERTYPSRFRTLVFGGVNILPNNACESITMP